jgi:hypothetical protein
MVLSEASDSGSQSVMFESQDIVSKISEEFQVEAGS